MQRTLRSVVVGHAYGIAGRLLRLPFNPVLRAHNMVEVALDRRLVDEAHDFYLQHIATDLGRANESFRSGQLSFYVKQPKGWGSDLKWWSVDDVPTYRLFERIFRRLGLDEPFRGIVDIETQLRVYTCGFATRSYCVETFFHSDFFPTCGTTVYSLLTPLDDYSPSDAGQFVYRDIDGNNRVYEYRKGTALAIGALLSHGTQPIVPGSPRAFLSFTFGTDKLKYWRETRRTIKGLTRQLCRPDGTWEYH